MHALLAHLEAVGFAAAPRLLGLDAEGREILTYVEGDVVWPDHFDLLQSDDALAEVARVVRRYHDVVTSFVPPADAQWWDLGADPSGVHELVCHNDFAPWNLVRSAGGEWSFIDWDTAAPGRRSWDLGWALLSFIPLTPDRPVDDDAIVRRLGVFMAGYGAPEELEEALAAAVERGEHEAARGGRDAGVWAGAAELVAANAGRWISAVK